MLDLFEDNAYDLASLKKLSEPVLSSVTVWFLYSWKSLKILFPKHCLNFQILTFLYLQVSQSVTA